MPDPEYVAPPPIEPADVYLYAFGNGAIFVYHPDARSMTVTLAQALNVVRSCGLQGGRVFLGADDGGLADHVVTAVRGIGTPIEDHVPEVKPLQWDREGDALMEAASFEQHELLDDYLARGADLHSRNEFGSTPLHHAAAYGNLHAIDRLLAAGADPDVRNDVGMTPHMAALENGKHEAALRLEAAGAKPAHLDASTMGFSRWHLLPLVVPVLLTVAWGFIGYGLFGSALSSDSPAWVGVLGAVVGLLLGLWFAGGRSTALWRGGVPRGIDGSKLRILTYRGKRTIDLGTVTHAAYGMGAGGLHGGLAGTKLVLVQPEGRPHARRGLAGFALLGKPEAGNLPDGDPLPVTVVSMFYAWEHQVLQAVGNRLRGNLAARTPLLEQRIELARRADPSRGARVPPRPQP